MTRPEEVMAFPFFAHDFEDGWARDHREAIAAACNAYPLALALAEAVENYANPGYDAIESSRTLYAALAAFLAHRQGATK